MRLKPDEIAALVIRGYQSLTGERGLWEQYWQEIAERMLPNYSRTFRNEYRSEGEKRDQLIFDSTAAIALSRFASIADSLLSPRNSRWHGLKASNPYLMKNREVQVYYEEVTNILFRLRYAPSANFSSQNQQIYSGLGAFGTSSMFTDELESGRGIRYKALHLGETYFRENHQGIVDEVYRYFRLTARQAYQKWGDAIPSEIKIKAEKSPDTNYYFIHCVKPRELFDYDPERLDHKGMKYVSYYVSISGSKLLSEGGYHSFPYAVSRYEQAPNELYGRSPAMACLPAVKTLNEEKKAILMEGQRAINPVLLTHDDGIIDMLSLRPGSAVAGGMNKDGRPLVGVLPTGNISVGKDLMDDERMVINDSFLVTLFQILTETPTMTATEVMERTREKGILLAPTFGRLQTEYLGPLIDRELDILSKQGVLPPMPQILIEAKGEYEVQYDSPLSRAAKAEEGAGLMRTVETALSIVNVTQNPEPLDHFNWDIIIPELAANQGTPYKWMRSMKEVEAIREGRSQAAEQQQQVAAAPAAAAMMNAATKAQTP